MNELTRRKFPNSIIPWMRFQFGRTITRPLLKPIYEASVEPVEPQQPVIGWKPSKQEPRVIGYADTGDTVEVFDLLGYGETEEQANIMAVRNLTRMVYATQ